MLNSSTYLYSQTVANTLLALARDKGFNINNIHARKLVTALKANTAETPSTIRAQVFQRYTILHFPSIIDEQVSSYNANRIGSNIYTGEGPYKDTSFGYDNMERFFDQVVTGKVDFQQIVAIGPFYNRESERFNFTDYLKNATYGNFEVKAKRSIVSDDLDVIHLTVKQANETRTIPTKTIEVLHLKTMQDFNTLKLDNSFIIAKLLKLQELSNTSPIFMHCSAGLGRAGTVALALLLYRRFDELTQMDETQRANEIFKFWDDMNQKRPGTVQTEDQLINAIKITDAMHNLMLELTNSGKTLDKFIEEQVAAIKKRRELELFMTTSNANLPISHRLASDIPGPSLSLPLLTTRPTFSMAESTSSTILPPPKADVPPGTFDRQFPLKTNAPKRPISFLGAQSETTSSSAPNRPLHSSASSSEYSISDIENETSSSSAPSSPRHSSASSSECSDSDFEVEQAFARPRKK